MLGHVQFSIVESWEGEKLGVTISVQISGTGWFSYVVLYLWWTIL